MAAGEAGLLFEGLRVIELAADPAGEMVGKVLAEMGADAVDIGRTIAPIKLGEYLHVHNVKTKRW